MGWIDNDYLKVEVGPGYRVTGTAGGNISLYRFVKFQGDTDGDFVVCSANDLDVVGMYVGRVSSTSPDAVLGDAISGDSIIVVLLGTGTVTADMRVVAGEQVKIYDSGKVGPALTSTLANQSMGSGTGGQFTNQPTNDGVEVISSSTSDTTLLDIWGTTNGTSTVVRERVTLNGTTQVATTKTDWGDILGARIPYGYPAAVGTITIREASGNATITTITAGNRSSGIVEITSTTLNRAFNRAPTFSCSGVSTQIAGLSGTDSTGAELLASVTLAGTAEVEAPVTFRTGDILLLGDVATATTVTLKTADLADSNEIVGRALNSKVAGGEVSVLFGIDKLTALDENREFRVTGTIATGSVATLNATPVTVIPSPGPGKYIEVTKVHWFLDFESAGYDAAAAGDTLNLKYTDGSGAAVVDAIAGDAIGAATADYHTLALAVPELIPVADAPIVAHIAVGEWYGAAGDSPLKFDISYRVKTLAFA